MPRLTEHVARELYYVIDQPPAFMSKELRELHERILAVGDPAAVTRAERNQISHRLPPEEEDRLCREKVGLSLPELKDKVMTSGADTLTEDECAMILFRRAPYFEMDLLPDEKRLVQQVLELLANDYDQEVWRRTYFRDRAFDQVRKERKAKIKQEKKAAMEAKIQSMRPLWVLDMFAAKLPRWGFVVFRTAYGVGMDDKWKLFTAIHSITAMKQFHCWYRAQELKRNLEPLFVSESQLDGADIDTLRRRFKTMREQNEIPEGLATDCFLVVDKEVLNHPVITSKTQYQPKTPGAADAWDTTLPLTAVDPDYDESASVSDDGESSGFKGTITIPLPKVFDWLYYCFHAKSEDWETRYKNTIGGPAEAMVSIIESPFPTDQY
ncbi:hypothetical protein PFICI_14570 [Pestalotiopsis fici W106-1]|uniref:Uncharacterized protein n=1 Tax=Pestalotiopsis fici (strain W106-1 / CGMCC3.15140) TaxID=1229662 RepID=W3WIL0_PESFW|nr:uncharacterized protein PFICI_14570 [Pestalotiopsis fici W106-1]ETS73624.1 hypothetical protein PFICI_14570 [Pestalotiopsis fici W106-1]